MSTPRLSNASSISRRRQRQRKGAQAHETRHGQSSRSSTLLQGLAMSYPGPVCSNLSIRGEHIDGDVLEASDHEDFELPEVIMALDMRDSLTMGCAYFVADNGHLLVSEDISMADTHIAEQYLIHVQPTTVLVSSKCPEQLLEFLEKSSDTSAEGASQKAFILRCLQSSEFGFELCKERLFNLPTGPTEASIINSADDARLSGTESPVVGTSQGLQLFKSMRCGGSINLHSQVSVCCAGAVLGELHRRKSIGFLPNGQASAIYFHVESVQMFSLSGFMFINADALQSLQIVQNEHHPNSQTWGANPSKSGTKEALSVYGLFHHLVCTPQGKSQLRQLFLRPTLDLKVISERQQAIAMMLQLDNAEGLQQSASNLRKIRNIRTTMAQLRKGINFPSGSSSFNHSVWGSIRNFTINVVALRERVASFHGGSTVRITTKVLETIKTRELMSIGENIDKIVDFKQSQARQRSSVKAGVSPELDELKRWYDGMKSFLVNIVNKMCQELPEWASQYIRSCTFLPQLGFLTVVQQDTRTGDGLYEGEGSDRGPWTKLFVTEGAIYYKNGYMKELDEQYGDVYCQIGDREVEIIHSLAKDILNYEDVLVAASDACGEFDCMAALALGAGKYDWKAPQVDESRNIHIQDGRHPLQELVVPAFIPNDCYLGQNEVLSHGDSQHSRILVLTGPNHSGKSVYLKQVAIIVYLAHIGSFVPASRAVIGLTDKILTRISTRESMSGAESAFAIDLKQVSLSMRCATSKSLVLIDEFGKGTNADDGAGLVAAVLDHFLSLNLGSPRLLVTTHFHEVFTCNYLSSHGQKLRLAHMDFRVDWEASEAEDQVSYLFKLTPGHSTSSLGGRCAALNGVPSAIVERAEAITRLLTRNEDLSAICAQMSEEQEADLERAEVVARRFIEQDFGNPDYNEISMASILPTILS